MLVFSPWCGVRSEELAEFLAGEGESWPVAPSRRPPATLLLRALGGVVQGICCPSTKGTTLPLDQSSPANSIYHPFISF